MTNNNQEIPFLDNFQRELEYYKQLNQLMKLPKQRVKSGPTIIFSPICKIFPPYDELKYEAKDGPWYKVDRSRWWYVTKRREDQPAFVG